MERKEHRTILPSLEDALEKVRNQRGVGPSGLAGEGLGGGPPEIENPHEVSHTHPFTADRDEEPSK